MKRLLPAMLLLLPVAVPAQQGTIRYDRAVKYDFKMPENLPPAVKEQIGSAEVTPLVLLFDASESVMTAVRAAPVRGASDRVTAAAIRLKMGSVSRSDQERLLDTYVGLDAGTVAETRELMGRTFLIEGARPVYEWKLTGEESEFLGYKVQKATAVQDSTTIEAWFTPQIPVPGGPGLYGGLPGMILAVSVNDGHTTYAATEVSLDPLADGAIAAPSDGDRVSREEYEEIVAVKLKELEATRGRGRRDGKDR